MSIGLLKGTVDLEPHQEEWDIEGRRICAKIKELLGDDIVDARHVGSTSILRNFLIKLVYGKRVIDRLRTVDV